MKIVPIVLLAIVLLLNACESTALVKSNGKDLPPGQMKKVTGSQSAKPYAPGQKKKK